MSSLVDRNPAMKLSMVLGRLDAVRAGMAAVSKAYGMPKSILGSDIDALDIAIRQLEEVQAQTRDAEPLPLSSKPDLKLIRPADFDSADFNPEDCAEEWKNQEAVLRTLGIEPGEAHHLTFMVGWWRSAAVRDGAAS